jgi:hypothetical protein
VATATTVLAWLCIGFGTAFCVPELVKIARGNWPSADRSAQLAARSESWRDLRRNLAATSVGLSILELHQHGVLSWALGIPLLVIVPLNFAWWLATRIRHRADKPAGRPIGPRHSRVS